MIYKILSTEVDISSASNVSSAKTVRLLNPTASAVLVTYANSGGTTLGTITIGSNSEIRISKLATDTVAGTGIKATSIAYKG
jgi:hypothetical protein